MLFSPRTAASTGAALLAGDVVLHADRGGKAARRGFRSGVGGWLGS
jgi:hypothetical protein